MKSLQRIAGIAVVSLLASGSLSAQQLLSDNFNGENPAAGTGSSLGYTAFANWHVTGNVDLVNTPNSFTIVCGGKCVDLDGTTGPGSISTKLAYEFFAGDVMRFQFDVSGNQRDASLDGFLVGFGFTSPTELSSFNSSTSLVATSGPVNPVGVASNIEFGYDIAGTQAFDQWTYQFTAATSGSVTLKLATTSGDRVGPVIDNVTIDRISNPQPAEVPEPASAILLGAGLMGLAGIARRRSVA